MQDDALDMLMNNPQLTTLKLFSKCNKSQPCIVRICPNDNVRPRVLGMCFRVRIAHKRAALVEDIST